MEAIGRELLELSRRWSDLEAEGANLYGGERKTELEATECEIFDRMEALKAEACCTRATSLAGAMLQIMLVYGAVELLPERTLTDRDACERRALERMIQRALYSALDAMAATAGTAPEELGGELLMSADLNPFRLMEGGKAQNRN
ncbi:hypothetical protein [Stappia indica]|uniref:Uncharacterized protein n=1 Tax=Stappia indica TaxID=538381 RepID=A0A857CBY9_9HYPH|nr:hypothetical protein [Stappia indica]QGZ36583.1 hypothetical protein GH266_20085 [Stappia indica]